MSDLCGEWTGSRVDLLNGQVRSGAIWCKSWHCEYCAPIRQKQLMRQAADGHPRKFITLTSRYRPDEMSADQAAQQLVHAWRMVVQRAKREGIWTECQYIAVFEGTKKSWPHLHILARCNFVVQKWLSDRLREYADSPIVHVRAVESRRRAAWYVAKYTAKAPDKFQGCKRYWRTHGYDLSEGRKDKCLHDHFQGYLATDHVTGVASMYAAHHYAIEWDSDHSFVAVPQELDIHAGIRAQHQRKHRTTYKENTRCTST
jgi:hypothetical protein